MENQTPFDLSSAIGKWRRNLAESSAFRSADLDELEAHLRDAIPGLLAGGLSSEEAFLIACRRLGTRSALESEFVKINAGRTFLNRPWVSGLRFAMVFMILTLFGVGIAIDTTTRQAISARNIEPAWFSFPGVFGVILLFMAIFGAIGYVALLLVSKSGSERLANIDTRPKERTQRSL